MSTVLDATHGVRVPDKLFIGGRFVDALDGRTLPVRNPHDNSVIAHVALAGAADVDRAGVAARAAFPAWSRRSAGERGRLLLKLADAIEANADELARLETLNTGHPIRDTRGLDVPRTAATFRYFGGMADKFEGTIVPVDAGFLDSFREFEKGGGHYTWWSVFSGARSRNVGWRLDYFLISQALRPRLKKAFILPKVLGSDHCPVAIELA